MQYLRNLMKTKDDIYEIFKSIKIKEEFIIIHSDVVGLAFNNFSLAKLWDLIFYGLGANKTYIFPTFTFTRNKIWNYYQSKSETGILSEFFRKNISTKRTIHPVHSVSIFGKNANEIIDHNSESSFGKGSVWEWMCNNKDVCNLSLGVKLEGGATICHFPEEFVGVNYREFVHIKDKILGPGKKIIKRKFTYYGRKINRNGEGLNNWSNCEKDLLKSKILKRKFFLRDKYPISIMNANMASEFIISKLKKNPYYIGKFVEKN
jgi:aminoglycoside 3-N-acetyltransferase